MMPGKKNKKFKMLLSENWFTKGDILIAEHPDHSLVVVGEPKLRDKWWWKILRFITFGYFFQPDIYYTVKIHEKYEKT